MVRAKNYETKSTFIKVMQKKNCGLFFSGHRVVCVDRINCMTAVKCSSTQYTKPLVQVCTSGP